MQLPIKIKMNVNLQKQYVLALLYIMHMKDILDYFFLYSQKQKTKPTLIVIVLRKMNLFGFSYWQSNLWNGLENN